MSIPSEHAIGQLINLISVLAAFVIDHVNGELANNDQTKNERHNLTKRTK